MQETARSKSQNRKPRASPTSFFLSILFFSAFAFATITNAACRQALVLGLDVSGSVNSTEYRLQLDGLAGALSDAEVRSSLFAMPSAPIDLLVYEWSGPRDQTLILNWRTIKDTETLNNVIRQLRQTRRAPATPSTALGSAMNIGIGFLNQRPDCWKRTLDISGDGISNTGPHPRSVQTPSIANDITINALVIGDDQQSENTHRHLDLSDLSSYFKAFVISGPDAFVETALGFAAYEAAMIRKLKRELEGVALSQLQPPPIRQ